MKKLFMYFALALTVLAMPGMAQAYTDTVYGWTFDLSGYGGTVLTDIKVLNVSGSGYIEQDLGTDLNINTGETFNIESTLYTVGYTNMDGDYSLITNSNGDALSFVSSNLEGYVDYVDPVTGAFTYTYTSGNIGMYIGSTLLAELDLAWGNGNSTSQNDGGNALQGDTDFQIDFITNVLGSLISFGDGNYDGVDISFVFDIDNELVDGTEEDPSQWVTSTTVGTGEDAVTYYTLHADVSTGGVATLVATPEPSTFLILGFGLLGLVGFRKKFKKA